MDYLLRKIRQELSSKHNMSNEEAFDLICDIILRENTEIDSIDEINALAQKYYLKTRTKLGILTPLIKDKDVSEIMINGKDNIFVEKNGKMSRINLSFDSTEELEDIIRYIAGEVHREINEMNPIVDARLSDGSMYCGSGSEKSSCAGPSL